MGLGQTLLTIMALMLMGRVILMMNTTTLDVGYSKDLAEYRISGTSLGTSMLEQVNGLAFDEATVNADLTPAQKANLTDTTHFGPDAGETTPDLYDDIDDYNRFAKYDTLQNGISYKTTVQIEYVNIAGSAITATSTKGFNKRITVKVTSDFLIDYSVTPNRADTLKFQSIFCYWFFR
jgi:hypothetical protein